MSFIEPAYWSTPGRHKKLEARIKYVQLVDPKSRELPYLMQKHSASFYTQYAYNDMLNILVRQWQEEMHPTMFPFIFMRGLQWNPPSFRYNSIPTLNYVDKWTLHPHMYIVREIYDSDPSTLICESYNKNKVIARMHAYIQDKQLCICRDTIRDPQQFMQITWLLEQHLPIRGVISILSEYIMVSSFYNIRGFRN